MSSSRRLALHSILFGVAGGAAGWFFTKTAVGSGWGVLPYCAGIAAALCFALCWSVYFRRIAPGAWIGAAVGAVASTLAHPLAWYLMICVNWVATRTGHQEPSIAGDALNPATGLAGAAVFTFWSLLVAGWVTLPAGAILGGLIGAMERRRSLKAVVVAT